MIITIMKALTIFNSLQVYNSNKNYKFEFDNLQLNLT